MNKKVTLKLKEQKLEGSSVQKMDTVHNVDTTEMT